MLDSDILRTISQFAEAAANAQAAGFDGVEIMGSEGYLINEFTVTHTNKREDAWAAARRTAIVFLSRSCARCASAAVRIY